MNKKNTVRDEQLKSLATILYQRTKQEKHNKMYSSTKEVLSLLAMGVLISSALFAPKASYVLAKKLDIDPDEWKAWRHFNQAYLRQTLRRMVEQKLVTIDESAGKTKVTITNKGRTHILEYALEEMSIQKTKKWDKKWRIVIYDIPQTQKKLQETMRIMLKKLGFLQIQKSIYLSPYPCFKEIEFIREYYGIGSYLKYLLVIKLEDDSAYKDYFGVQ